MTSNIGSHIINDKFKNLNDNNRDEIIEHTRLEVYELMKQTIRPEFLNRIDDIIMFTPLTISEVREIVILQIGSVKKMLADNGMTIEVSPKAIDFLSEEGYDPQFGARPIKRTIQRHLINELSKQILSGTIDKDMPIVVDSDSVGLIFRDNK